MCSQSEFHTQKGYELTSENNLTSTMEDYLEMIFRLSREQGYTRVHLLANQLNVRPSSVSKMVDNLKEQGFVESEKYGCIRLTAQGKTCGEYLIRRHDLLNRFLCFLNHSEDELKQVERIEHFIDERTILNIERWLTAYNGQDNAVICPSNAGEGKKR